MNKIISFAMAVAVAFGMSVNAFAAEPTMLKKVDYFSTVLDQSGSMYFGSKCTGTKMMTAKNAISSVLMNVPEELKYDSEFAVTCGDKQLYAGEYKFEEFTKALGKVKNYGQIFGHLTPLAKGLGRQAELVGHEKKSAVLLATDGDWNRGENPVLAVEELYKKYPNTTVHIISVADTDNGRKTIEEIAALKKGSVIVNACDLLDTQKAKEFAEYVFFGMYEPLTIYFDFDKSNIKESEQKKIDAFLESGMIGEVVSVEGYTDKLGSVKYNEKLGQKRADVVAKAIGASEEVKVVSHGEKFAKASKKDKAGRALERKAEIILK